MKSSTIRRSTLSKETMMVIENLAKTQENDSLGEYVRPDEIIEPSKDNDNNGMSQEIDLLWQNFKTTQFNSNSPIMYVMTGVLIGSISTLLLVFGINAISATKNPSNHKPIFGIEKVNKDIDNSSAQTLEAQAGIEQEDVSAKVSVPSEDSTNADSEKVEASSELKEVGQAFDDKKMKKYVVKSGDTVETIIKKNYGSYSEDKAELIRKANNLKTLDRINIDQELLIPIE